MSNQEKRRTKEEMFPIIEAWQSSGLTKQVFCDQQGMAKSVFFYWHKKYKAEQDPGGFLPMKIEDDSSHTKIEIVYPNGIMLRFPGNTSSAIIRQYLHL
jgi:hypothetical protein